MPVVAWWAVSAIATGIGFKFFGDGVEDTGKGIRDAAIAVAVVGGVYLVAKKQGIV